MKTEERPHHPYSPSTLQNLEWCPHYRSRQMATPHIRTAAGTRAHGVVESGEDDHLLSDEDALAAAECLDFVDQRRRLMQEECDRARLADRPGLGTYSITELKETYLPVDKKRFSGFTSTTAGYSDVILLNYDKTYAEGFDWKFGMWPVEEPSNNLQVIAYSLGIFRMFPTVQRVKFWIKQPYLDVTKSADFVRKQVPEMYLRVQTVAARARKAREAIGFKDANPAVPVCNFCDNLGRCDKVCALACKVGRKFHPVEVPEDITPTMLREPDKASLGLRLAAVVAIWAEAFRRQVTDRVLRREQELPPGFKVQSMRKREVVDPAKLKEVALKHLTQAEFESTLETTFGALETLVQDKAPRGSKKAALAQFQQDLEAAGAVQKGEEFSFLRAIAEDRS